MVVDSSLALGVLLVVAAAAGWVIARLTTRRTTTTRSAVPPADFYRGLNHLLRDESDKALAVLQSIAEADSGMVEIHFALGTLFRQRGETDRAIRIHQNLLARPDLARRHREQALFSLAEDYLKAGLFDRAEALFVQLIDQGVQRSEALQRLVSIYERQRDWNQAIDARRQLANLLPGNHAETIAQYYCEIAQQARETNDLAQMRAALKSARGASRNIVRGALMRADLAILKDDVSLAVKLYRKLLESTPELAALVLLRLHGCFDATSAELSRTLREALRRQPELANHLAKAALAADLSQNDVVAETIRTYIADNPALATLSENYEDNYSALTEMLHSLGLARLQFRCRECGYSAGDLFWQCPACQSWDSAQTDIRITAEATTEI
ncbi:MAG: hypothetical protein OER80_14005 [Gammaproteobacteria bacterium]|nr:hypothetical protein [Gammaproteobacteria bacterium]MDH3767935.1 hypothetical protein [Gammaproteobacteria bacterium]